FLAAAVRDHRDLGGETLDVLRLLLQEARRDEQRKVGVARAGLLDAPVEFVAQVLPDGEAVRPEHDTSAHRRVIRQFRANNQFVVPGGEILPARRNFLFVELVGHSNSAYAASFCMASATLSAMSAAESPTARIPRNCLSGV